MGVTSEGACKMPEHMKRREAVYYFRRVVPKDLQAAGEPREICRSLKTRDFADAKERLHKENVRFDEWVRSKRDKLHKTRQMDPAYKNALDLAAVEAAEEGDAYSQ